MRSFRSLCVRIAARFSWAGGVLLLMVAAWLAWPSAPVRPLPGSKSLLQQGGEGACVAVAAVEGGLGGQIEIRVEGPLVMEGCGGCAASGPWPVEGCEVRLRPVSRAPGPFGGTLEVRQDGRPIAFLGLSGYASGLLPALHWRAIGGETGVPPLVFELRNLGDAPGPPGVPVLMGPNSGGLRIAWTDCGMPLPPGGTCGVRVEIVRPGAAGLLSLPGGGPGIRVGANHILGW